MQSRLKLLTLFFRPCSNPHPARRLDAIPESPIAFNRLPFQSSPSPKTGCNINDPPGAPTPAGSNPHPARRLDAITFSGVITAPRLRFQSSPSPKTGCNAPKNSPAIQRGRSNPHPARRLDAILLAILSDQQDCRSNPHPARRLDAMSSQNLESR